MKIVRTILKQNTAVGSLEKVDMLFDFIHPLIYDAEDGTQDSDDEEVGILPSQSPSVFCLHCSAEWITMGLLGKLQSHQDLLFKVGVHLLWPPS